MVELALKSAMAITVYYKLNISRNEAMTGVKKVITRKSKRLEVTIPAGVKTGSLVRLSGALLITDGYSGDLIIRIKVKRRYRAGVIAGIAIACFFTIIYFIPTEDANPNYIYTNGAIECGGDGKPIELIDNPNASNCTYAELLAFIDADPTDTNVYLEGSYVCANFAEDVHNNAEAAGIRAAWVGIDLEGEEQGHALNAFETTDKGLVYIDCTGGGLASRLATLVTQSQSQSWDTVAYIEIGCECGFMDISYAESPSYSFYEEYVQKWQEFETKLESYNREVDRYNQEISGKVYIIGSAEDARMTAWEARLEQEEQALDKLTKELEGFYEPSSVVEDIHVHWEE
jgi:hypothetical protein